jgi:DNA-binding response OmpR family regulator
MFGFGVEPIAGRRVPSLKAKETLLMEEPVVLIVDDDACVQSIVQDALSDGGFASRCASSGEEASVLLNAPNQYRVLIVDISFGKDQVKGWSIARRARAFDPNFPVVYITGGNADEWAVHGVPNSILIRKPFASAQLLTTISQLLNTGSEGLAGKLFQRE